jgi:hypothetical protein
VVLQLLMLQVIVVVVVVALVHRVWQQKPLQLPQRQQGQQKQRQQGLAGVAMLPLGLLDSCLQVPQLWASWQTHCSSSGSFVRCQQQLLVLVLVG